MKWSGGRTGRAGDGGGLRKLSVLGSVSSISNSSHSRASSCGGGRALDADICLKCAFEQRGGWSEER